MEQRKLGNSEVYVSPVAFGSWAIGGWMWGGAEDKDAIKAIQSAIHHGITTFDTAPVYGFGKSEELIGKALQGIPRDNYQLLTKFGMNWETSDGEYYFDTVDNDGKPVKMYKWASQKKIIQECEQSLKRLKTEYIDLYQIHWPDATTPIHETFEAVQKLMKQGKVRAPGVCNYNSDQVTEALKSINLVSNQVPYSLINKGIEKQIIPQAIQKGLSILAYSPLQRGLLTGKIKSGHTFNIGDTRNRNRFYTDENIRKTLSILDSIKPIAEKYNVTMTQLIIHWTTVQKAIGCVLVGARNEQQVLDNVKSLDFKLSEEDINTINKAAENFTLNE